MKVSFSRVFSFSGYLNLGERLILSFEA